MLTLLAMDYQDTYDDTTRNSTAGATQKLSGRSGSYYGANSQSKIGGGGNGRVSNRGGPPVAVDRNTSEEEEDDADAKSFLSDTTDDSLEEEDQIMNGHDGDEGDETDMTDVPTNLKASTSPPRGPAIGHNSIPQHQLVGGGMRNSIQQMKVLHILLEILSELQHLVMLGTKKHNFCVLIILLVDILLIKQSFVL